METKAGTENTSTTNGSSTTMQDDTFSIVNTVNFKLNGTFSLQSNQL